MQLTIQQAMEQAVQLHSAGKLKEAESMYRQILTHNPLQADALHLMGLLAAQVGKNHTAITLINQAIQAAQPSPPSLYLVNLSGIYLAEGNVFDAEAIARKGLITDQQVSGLWNNLGNSLYLQGKILEAAEAFKKAFDTDASNAGALSNWANIMQETGNIREAMSAHKQACCIDANHKAAADNYLRDIGFLQDLDPTFIRDEHAAWAKEFEKTIDATTIHQNHGNSTDPAKRLKIGFISPDFRLHSVSYFMEPLFRHFDREQFEIYSYSAVVRPDETTLRLQSYPLHWRNIAILNDQQAAQMISDDGIDILIDLAGHTSDNRCRILALRPAPLQMTYLGYPFSTGIKECDFRITDMISDPVGLTDDHYTEKLLRLPSTTWCFQPYPIDIDVVPTPALKNGYVTFGSFNTYNKINNEVIDVWCEIIKRVPRSRLFLKAHGFADEMVRDQLLAKFQSRGVDPARLKVLGRQNETKSHLELYSEIDVALDAFPYNGTTTTCEAMWQGLPVVTIEGNTHVSRVGVVLNTCVGRKELIAKTREQYVDIAVNLASDIVRLENWRSSARTNMMNSELCDQISFSRNFETILKQAWHNWCIQQKC